MDLGLNGHLAIDQNDILIKKCWLDFLEKLDSVTRDTVNVKKNCFNRRGLDFMQSAGMI